MPQRSTFGDHSFLLTGFDDDGGIRSAVFYRAPGPDGLGGGKSRAYIVGLKTFHVYRLNNPGKESMEFERLG